MMYSFMYPEKGLRLLSTWAFGIMLKTADERVDHKQTGKHIRSCAHLILLGLSPQLNKDRVVNQMLLGFVCMLEQLY